MAILELNRGLKATPSVARRTRRAKTDNSVQNRGDCAFRGDYKIGVRTGCRPKPQPEQPLAAPFSRSRLPMGHVLALPQGFRAQARRERRRAELIDAGMSSPCPD